jgi:hypothetical protein
LNGKRAGDRSDITQSSQVHPIAAGTSDSIAVRDIPMSSPQVCQVQAHHKIISGTTIENELYVAKLHNKLPKNIRRLLQEYANRYFMKPDEDIQFKYYQTRSNEITELEMNAFSICKGLLAWLNPRNESPKKLFVVIKWYPIVQNGSVLTKANVKLKLKPSILSKVPVAYIIVPLFDGNNDSVMLELKPGEKKQNK